MESGDCQFRQGQAEGHLQGQGDGQVQTGFDTFVMTGDMIIRTTPKPAAPSTRPKPGKLPPSDVHSGDHISSDTLPTALRQTCNGDMAVPPTVASWAGMAGYPDVPVELDIPPDDISSEDERYRVDCVEELDVTNLPPPPAEFLGDFSDSCPTSVLPGTAAAVEAGLPRYTGQSENWRNSLDEAIMRLESCTAFPDSQIGRDVSSHQPPVGEMTRLGIGLNTNVLSAGRANSSGSLVSSGSGVRASKSQDNWLQCSGTGVGLVNIDVDCSSASIEALHCDVPRSCCLDSLDTPAHQNKTDNVSSNDDVWLRATNMSDDSKLLSDPAAKEKNIVNSDEKPVGSNIFSPVVEPPSSYHDSPSTQHMLSWHSSGQRLLGGGKVSAVRGPFPPVQNGTESTSWNNVADGGHQQPKDADHPSACRLAKRLYHLDGFRKSDVSKHLSKKYVQL